VARRPAGFSYLAGRTCALIRGRIVSRCRVYPDDKDRIARHRPGADNILNSAFSEQSKSSCRFGVAAGQVGCAHADRSAEADVTSSSEEELGGQLSTARPLSVALGPRSHRHGPAKPNFPDMAASPPPWRHSPLSCDVVPVVQRIGMSAYRSPTARSALDASRPDTAPAAAAGGDAG
jgi:hypothetical protein